MTLRRYDLAIAWCWEYDADLVFQIDVECGISGILSYLIHSHNLSETLRLIKEGELRFRFFFDRASDLDENFEELVDVMMDEGTEMINDPRRVRLAIDKAAMQKKFSARGIDVPYTVVLPPWEKRPEAGSIPLSRLGKPFVVKPACGGCGDGVITDARTQQDIQKARQQFPDDKYLVQKKVEPIMINGRRAWFRVFFAFGEILPCWWDDQTKIADVLSISGIDRKIYERMVGVMRKIAHITKLDLFSTELALNHQGKLLVIDHVNDQVDLRRKSSCLDGVPDEVVDRIVNNLVNWVRKRVRRRGIRRESRLCKKM